MPPFAFAAGLSQGVNIIREAGNRIVGVPEIVGSLAGSQRPKKLRIRVVILRDEEGQPVATPEGVEASLAEARRVLHERLAIDLLAAAEPLVRTLDVAAPRPPSTHPAPRAPTGPTSARAACSSAVTSSRGSHRLGRPDHGLRRPRRHREGRLLARTARRPRHGGHERPRGHAPARPRA